MCTRYALEKDLPELKDIFEIALRSSLTSKFIDTHSLYIMITIRFF